jgi:pimeloyl-ACP methyl ester carboxylesterase
MRDPARTFLYTQVSGLSPDRGSQQVPSVEDADLTGFSVPTLFLYGSEDTVGQPEVGRLAATLIPRSRYVEVPGAGHSVYWERPDEFNGIVSRFFKEVGGFD